LLNIQLANASTQLAFFSYRDSSSMKTLAVVTMFFLPGSFVSALFSTNLFNWDARDLTSSSISVPSTPQMKLYWIITVLLTVATFALYVVWLRFLKRQSEKEMQAATDREAALGKNEKAVVRGGPGMDNSSFNGWRRRRRTGSNGIASNGMAGQKMV
jgi:hypothetical protein